jgi:hypothetical protein
MRQVSLKQKLLLQQDLSFVLLLQNTSHPKRSPAKSTTEGVLLVFINAHRTFHKRTDTVTAFTREYSRVSYLSTGKQ